MKTYLQRLLFLLLTLSPFAASAAGSGVYSELTLGLDPQSQVLSGYYQNGTGAGPGGGPQFSCIFYLIGKKAGDGYAIQTWFPGDGKGKQVIAGELRFVAGSPASVQLKLKEEPGGCGMVNPDLDKPAGSTLVLDTPGQWIEVRVAAAKHAFFYANPDEATKKKAYVVQGDALRVWEKKPGWVLADFEGKTKGWLKETDLYPTSPSAGSP